MASSFTDGAMAAVLISGGLDSVVLLADEAERHPVQPVYVSVGLAWERAERAALEHVLASPALAAVRPLIALGVDMTDVYPADHWALLGRPPAYHTADEEVYLAGRNVVLLGKAAVYCATAGIGRVLLGTLDRNPFPDATPAFRDAMAAALSIGLAHPLRIEAPYAGLSKADVIRRGTALGLPLALTLSCMRPALDAGTAAHCGVCSKCRERHDAFVATGIPDRTIYADRRFVGDGHAGTPVG